MSKGREVIRTLGIAIVLILLSCQLIAQQATLSGQVKDQASNAPLENVLIEVSNFKQVVFTDSKGVYRFESIPLGTYQVRFSLLGYSDQIVEIKLSKDRTLDITLSPFKIDLKSADITDKSRDGNLERMPSVQSTGIYRGMKSEVLEPAEMTVNLSTNNSRQVYAKVPGITIWESDGAGIQLGIGARGLSPNRTSHFNVRQNGYDISADALGYPESYYSPPLEAVERIEIVRGASALQYGSQFGGLLNFKMKSGLLEDGNKIVFKQSIGTYGLADSIAPPIAFHTSFLSLAGKRKQTQYYVFYQYKAGSGWRPNSGFDVHTGFVQVKQQINERWNIGAEYTHMSYLAQQPGGLTDQGFSQNARVSNRDRNWFQVKWNLAAVHTSYSFSPTTELNSQFFGLLASREALGFLGETQRPDPLVERDLISGDFRNIGNETRIIHKIVKDDRYWVFAGGVRVYKGFNAARQGSASAESDANFDFVKKPELPESNYTFPSTNFSVFGQSIIPITTHLSFTPGVRYEYISTRSDGNFNNILLDGAGNLIENTTVSDRKKNTRDFVLGGGGLSYQKYSHWEVYANVVQNYRAINFSDIQIRNTSLVIDTLISDERGFNADIGMRGTLKKVISYDASLFMLVYNDRIGEVNRNFDLLGVRRFRSNISDARSIGIEAFGEIDFVTLLASDSSDWSGSWFVNASYIDARYTDPADDFFFGNRVELVPEYTFISGLSGGFKSWSARVQWALTGQQFSDAGNVGNNPDFPATANAVDGIIPAYHVLDATFSWKGKRWSSQFSINNLLDERYFTRRASGYPGPGIIPSDGRAFYLSVALEL